MAVDGLDQLFDNWHGGHPTSDADAQESNLWTIDQDLGKVARQPRADDREVLAIFRGAGVSGHTTGNSPGMKWVALNAIGEHLDYGPRYTTRTNQVQRSFEGTALKQRAAL